MPYFIAAQIVGLFGTAASFVSFQMKKNRNFYILQGLCGIFFAINFFMLGAYTGSVLNLLNVFRGGIFVLGEKGHKLYLLIILQALYIASAIFTYTGPLTLITLVAQLAGTFAMWSQNGKTIRIVQLSCTSPLWLTYNICVFSIGGIICETFNILSILISILRFGINGFEKQPNRQ